MSLTNMQPEMSAVGVSISSAGQNEDWLHIFGGGVGGESLHWVSQSTERKTEIYL